MERIGVCGLLRCSSSFTLSYHLHRTTIHKSCYKYCEFEVFWPRRRRVEIYDFIPIECYIGGELSVLKIKLISILNTYNHSNPPRFQIIFIIFALGIILIPPICTRYKYCPRLASAEWPVSSSYIIDSSQISRVVL